MVSSSHCVDENKWLLDSLDTTSNRNERYHHHLKNDMDLKNTSIIDFCQEMDRIIDSNAIKIQQKGQGYNPKYPSGNNKPNPMLFR